MILRSFEKAVEITRGDTVEVVHAAAIAVCGPSGEVIASLGNPGVLIVMRSAAKPFQAAAALASGAADRFGLTQPEIALMAGSHSGQRVHQEAAASILSRIGLDPSALQCGAHVPFSRETARSLARDGEEPSALMNNCSGKHAGMLAAARAGGHPAETYLEPDHPVQRANLESVAAFTGRETTEIGVGVDGCSAPTFSVTLGGLARAFACIATGKEEGSPLQASLARVAGAMRAHPAMVAGEGMLDTCLMEAVPGLVAKVGADGIHAMAWQSPSGPLGTAVKLMDGDVGRGRTAVVLGLLRGLGAIDENQALPEALSRHLAVSSHRKATVGRVRSVFTLREGV
jgi:L-asparaginase II